MRSAILAAPLFAVLSVACAGSQDRPAVDPSSDPAWIPPGQGDLEVADSQIEPKAKPKPRPRHLQEPNHRDVDTRPLHAKTLGSR
jgi:hypothetical protein